VARVGDTPASWALPMANVRKDWKVQKLGKISFGAQDPNFVRSKHELSGKVISAIEFERLSIGLAVGAGMSDDRFTGANAKVDVARRVARDLTLGASSSVTGLGVTPKGSSSVDLKYAGSGAGANLSLSLSGLIN
jgi:hypothetical protein